MQTTSLNWKGWCIFLCCWCIHQYIVCIFTCGTSIHCFLDVFWTFHVLERSFSAFDWLIVAAAARRRKKEGRNGCCLAIRLPWIPPGLPPKEYTVMYIEKREREREREWEIGGRGGGKESYGEKKKKDGRRERGRENERRQGGRSWSGGRRSRRGCRVH